jgi:glutamate racemase
VDTRPVGFLDSGLGGISVLGEALRILPEENFIYFGDTRHIPYGDKPPETVYQYTHAAVDTLMERGCKAIVIACNTATSVAAAQLRQELPLPIIGMEPALKPASLLPGDGRVLVMATRNTLKLPKFQALMELYGQGAIPVPCSGLMECVEEGQLSGQRVEGLLAELFAPYANETIKAVVLGCTHYPFLRQTISRFFSANVQLIDGNLGTVRQLRRRLEEENLLSPGPGGTVTFLSSLDGEEPILRMLRMLTLWQSSET